MNINSYFVLFYLLLCIGCEVDKSSSHKQLPSTKVSQTDKNYSLLVETQISDSLETLYEANYFYDKERILKLFFEKTDKIENSI